MKAKILWIEGRRADSPLFVPGLRKKGYSVEMVGTGKAALIHLAENSQDLIVVNAASLRTSGKRICQDLRQNVNGARILLITGQDMPAVEDSLADVVIKLPFTLRKLVNRIEHLVPQAESKLLHAGQISLDLETRRVKCLNKEGRLTPRLMRLLRILMQHPGEVQEREHLFREVWKTEYTGDTRTLDVHISWLRQAIEEDPRNPRFLKTMRGIGYRLDV